ncbi:DUF4349 domain-containing protein [Aestuariivivens marinum]|uniref:DUF4349 domain-containing protein n=1 Tax=Aestuariivivens marinum TaxID=2913555 RepID=UPI001F5763A0|nr:DUF4349 domain-containing protein [Aestuariivivens marinum]
MKSFIALLLLFLPLMCSKESKKINNSETFNYDSEIISDVKASSVNGIVSTRQEVYPQKTIKESFLRFETQDLDKTYSLIHKTIQENKGFVQEDRSNKSYNTITRHLTIRIPSNNFKIVLDSISKQVSYFDAKRISSKDVTEEFIDLEARLKAKQTLEKRYLELLSKAKNVKEILEIERELSKIREEIEAKQGRLKYLENKVSLSTLDIEFYKRTSEMGVTVSYGNKMWNAIKSGFNSLSIFFIGILHIWPFILLLIITVFWFRRWLKKKK